LSLIRGRFKKEADKEVSRYTASIPFDWRLYEYDIAGSIAHAGMLAKQGIISREDARKICAGLRKIKKEIEQDVFEFDPELEDIHMNIESRLTAQIGQAGAKLHTARSRNDQVALDMRLFTRKVTRDVIEKIHRLQSALVQKAEENFEAELPGYTHLQRAQPVLFAHHMLAYCEMLGRDSERFEDCLERVDVMPLGSGALAGVAYDIDREYVARQLGFSKISRNSLDAVSDRDFIIEYEAAASICMMHLSRLAEELVLWSSAEFSFIELDDAYTTGSSIMPQKKNPDVAELGRGKTGRVYGSLIGILTTLKGLPLSYNKDLQEDKEGFFDTVDTLLDTLSVFTGMISTMQIKPEKMRAALREGYLLATDIADYLVERGVTFRDAHAVTGNLVAWAIENKKSFDEITLSEYREFSSLFDEDVYRISIKKSLAARNIPGGTSPEQVAWALKEARRMVDESRNKKTKI